MSPIDIIGFGRGGGGGGGPAFPQSASLQGSWNLFGGNVNQTDNSGKGNHLLPNNMPGQAIGGGPDGVNCADLDAASAQRYGISNASQVGLNPASSDFAWCIFYNPETLSGHQTICGKYVNSGNGEWYARYDFGDDRFEFVVQGDGTPDAQVNAGSNPTAGSFHWLAGYIDTVANEIGLSHNNTAFDTVAFAGPVIASTAPFAIGERGFTGNDFCNGKLAICHVWNGAIPTASEWTDLFNGGSGLRYSP